MDKFFLATTPDDREFIVVASTMASALGLLALVGVTEVKSLTVKPNDWKLDAVYLQDIPEYQVLDDIGDYTDLGRARSILARVIEAIDARVAAQRARFNAPGVYDMEGKRIPSLPLPSPTDDGWIPWSGGDMPVDGNTSIRVRFRGGRKSDTWRANSFQWGHPWRFGGDPDYDIVAYKIVG